MLSFQAERCERHQWFQFYEIDFKILNACWHGLPQSRKRLFVVALRREKIKRRFRWPTPSSKQRSFQSVLLPVKGGGRILGAPDQTICHTISKTKLDPQDRFPPSTSGLGFHVNLQWNIYLIPKISKDHFCLFLRASSSEIMIMAPSWYHHGVTLPQDL